MQRKGSSETESSIFSQIPIIDVKKVFTDKVFIWNNDGSIGSTIHFEGINDSGFRADDYRNNYQEVARALTRLASKEISIQFQVVRNSRVTDINSLPLNVPEMLHERVRFLGKLVNECEVFKNNFYISINSFPLKSKLTLKEKINSTVSTFKSLFDTGFDEDTLNAKYASIKRRMGDVSRIESQIVLLLNNLGIKSKVLETRQQYSDLYRSIISPSKFVRSEFKPDEEVSFRKDIFRGVEADEMPDYFVLDNYFHQVFELDYISHNYDFDENAISKLINVPFEHTYTVTFRSFEKKESTQLIRKVISQDAMNAALGEKGNGKNDDLEIVNDLERMQEVEEHMATTGQNILEFSATFTYRKKMTQLNKYLNNSMLTMDEFILENKENMYYQIFQYLGDSEWISPYKGQWDSFICTLPATSNIHRKKFETTFDIPENIVYMLPLFGRGRDDIDYYGFNHFFTDDLTTEYFDIFDPALDSWCTLISGDMGSGKSVTMNIIIANALSSLMVSKKMPMIRLIDYGGVTSSFFKLVKLLDGEIINVSKSKKPKINIMDISPSVCHPNEPKMIELIEKIKPEIDGKSDDEIKTMIYSYYDGLLDHDGMIKDKDREEYFLESFGISNGLFTDALILKRGECIPQGDKLRSLMTNIEIMLSSNPERLNTFSYEFQYDDMLTFVTEVYNTVKDRAPKIRDIVALIEDCLDENEETAFHEIAKRLKKWTINGQYKMFDSDSDVDLSNDVIMFDLFGVKKDPFLNAIYTNVIMDTISTDMFENMDRERLCLMDEAHQALETEGIRNTLVSFTRLSRKYKFPVILASQLPTDWFNADPLVGKVIVSQSTRFIFCGSKEKFVRDEAKVLYDLTDSEADAIGKAGVTSVGGTPHAPVFSKFLMISKTRKNRLVSVYRNILSPFEMELYSSSKEDNAIFRFYMNKRKMTALDSCRYITDKLHEKDEDLIEYLIEGNHTGALKKIGYRTT